MYERIYFIYSNVEYLSNEDFTYLMNNWDSELTQYKLHLESNCTKFKSCNIEWSPEIGFLVITTVVTCKSAKNCLRTGTPDPHNIIRYCLCSHLFDPRLISHSKVMIHIQITQHQLLQLAKVAPTLHQKHLLDLQKAAEEKGDSACSTVILEILIHDQERKKWHQINHTTRLPRGRAHITLQVQSGQLVNTYSMEHKMFEHTSDHLTQRFRLAHSAPCYQGKLFKELSFMGDTKCTQTILEGTYNYPPDTEE
jgi:hypothetical protein